MAAVLALADREISAVKNDNVLAAEIVDEVVNRGTGNLDHLAQESVFSIKRVGFTPTVFIRRELHRIANDNTIVTLNYIPTDYRSVRIYNSRDSSRTIASQVLNYSQLNNTIEVLGVATSGLYTFEYVDVGNVKTETEALIIPAEVFQVLFGEGGFGNYGFGE
jgi:hypothetical protein